MSVVLDDGVKRTILIVTIMASFVTPFMGSAINVALPAIGREFSLDAILLSWISTSFLLAAVVCLLPFGRLADIHGRVRVFQYGLATYAISSALAALATQAAMLLVARVAQGIGSAMIFGTGIAIISSVFPAGERGRALGLNVAAVYLGLSLGPVVGGSLTHHWGWRSIFWVNAILGVALIVLTRWKMKREFGEAKGERIDMFGAAVYGIAMMLLVYGLSSLPSWYGGALIVLSLVALAAFAAWEQRIDHPILEVRLLRNNIVFALSNLAALLNYSATFAVGFFLSLYLQYIRGFDAEHAGFILLSQPVMMAILSPVAGRASDRIEPRVVASVGMAFTVVGLTMMAFVGASTPTLYVISALLVLGVGFGLFSSPNTNAIMGSVQRRHYGVASAMVGTMRLTGQMLSMGVAAMIFAIFVGREQITPANHGAFLDAMRTAFICFAASCFVGIFVSLARGTIHDNSN